MGSKLHQVLGNDHLSGAGARVAGEDNDVIGGLETVSIGFMLAVVRAALRVSKLSRAAAASRTPRRSFTSRHPPSATRWRGWKCNSACVHSSEARMACD
jgi:hypothetical protein